MSRVNMTLFFPWVTWKKCLPGLFVSSFNSSDLQLLGSGCISSYIFEEVGLVWLGFRYKVLHESGLENVGTLSISNNPECSIYVLTTQPLVSVSRPPLPLPQTLFLLRLLFLPHSMLEMNNAVSCLVMFEFPHKYVREEEHSLFCLFEAHCLFSFWPSFFWDWE